MRQIIIWSVVSNGEEFHSKKEPLVENKGLTNDCLLYETKTRLNIDTTHSLNAPKQLNISRTKTIPEVPPLSNLIGELIIESKKPPVDTRGFIIINPNKRGVTK